MLLSAVLLGSLEGEGTMAMMMATMRTTLFDFEEIDSCATHDLALFDTVVVMSLGSVLS